MWNLLEFDSHTALVNEKDEICTYAQLYRESEGLAEHIDGRCLVFFALFEQYGVGSWVCDLPESQDCSSHAG